MADNYLIYGDDEFLIQRKVRELAIQHAGQDSWDVEKIETWPDLQDKLFNLGMFAERRVFQASYEVLAAAPSLDSLGAMLESHDNVLIISAYRKPDKRSHYYKKISSLARVLELNAPKGSELVQWLVKRGAELGARKMDYRAGELLLYLAGPNMMLLENELQKLIAYNPIVDEDSVGKLAVRDFQVSIFSLVDWVMKGDSARALSAVDELISGGAAEPYILHMLARQYRMLFHVLFYRQKGYGTGEIQKLLPMHPYAFQKLMQQSAGIVISTCASSLHLIAQADYDYKTGRNQGTAMLQVLVHKLAKK